MSDVVIRVEGVGKKYRIGHHRIERYTALRDVIARKVRGVFSRTQRDADERHAMEDFWALDDVSFEVRRGEIIGIIGRNGAGKSTLLKILSRITEPSKGRIELDGTVASLLEVGTGFHPELTGRENIFLNGAILGMSRAEVTRKFEEIVAFAEIAKFLDTPVKRFSSGMYVRLAFAVAAHLEPDILFVDEVLAVGDAAFQKKCIGKIEEVATRGRTVLFVSHDMGRIAQLCGNGLLLNEGKVECQGDIPSVVAQYLKNKIEGEGCADLKARGDRSGSGNARFTHIELLRNGSRCTTPAFGEELTIGFEIEVAEPSGGAHVALTILTDEGVPVHCFENVNEGAIFPSGTGTFRLEISIPNLLLYPGGYVIDLWIGDYLKSRIDYLRNAISFQLIQTRDSGLTTQLDRRDGCVFASSKWDIQKHD